MRFGPMSLAEQVFFSPELCTKQTSGTYDGRVVDLWACGVTLYLWCCGRSPLSAPTTAMLMQAIQQVEEVVPAPAEATAELGGVIEGLMTRDPANRLTLNRLRLHPWLTNASQQPMPEQPVVQIEVTAEEISLAFSNRESIKVGSAAGPSFLGTATGDGSSGWTREGAAIIRKRSTPAEAAFYSAIAASGHLSPHIPIIYSIEPASNRERSSSRAQLQSSRTSDRATSERTTDKSRASDKSDRGSHGSSGAPGGAPASSTPRDSPEAARGPEGDPEESRRGELDGASDIRMQDLVAHMTVPCAMALIMGTRTLTPTDLSAEESKLPRPELLTSLRGIDADAPTDGEKASPLISSGSNHQRPLWCCCCRALHIHRLLHLWSTQL